MKLALGKATVGMANTAHIVWVEVAEKDGKETLSPFGVYCGARQGRSGVSFYNLLTEAFETEKLSVSNEVLGQALETLKAGNSPVCAKCEKTYSQRVGA
jgi:hypothetical protein